MGLILQYISILIELFIATIGLLLVFKKKKKYGWFIFLAFFIYVIYDSGKILGYSLNLKLWCFMFFIATISAFYAVWQILKDKQEIQSIKDKKDIRGIKDKQETKENNISKKDSHKIKKRGKKK